MLYAMLYTPRVDVGRVEPKRELQVRTKSGRRGGAASRKDPKCTLQNTRPRAPPAVDLQASSVIYIGSLLKWAADEIQIKY